MSSGLAQPLCSCTARSRKSWVYRMCNTFDGMSSSVADSVLLRCEFEEELGQPYMCTAKKCTTLCWHCMCSCSKCLCMVVNAHKCDCKEEVISDAREAGWVLPACSHMHMSTLQPAMCSLLESNTTSSRATCILSFLQCPCRCKGHTAARVCICTQECYACARGQGRHGLHGRAYTQMSFEMSSKFSRFFSLAVVFPWMDYSRPVALQPPQRLSKKQQQKERKQRHQQQQQIEGEAMQVDDGDAICPEDLPVPVNSIPISGVVVAKRSGGMAAPPFVLLHPHHTMTYATAGSGAAHEHHI
eukprot:1144640-Pelagomonas_calceolata.AAC.7